ncbi:MAG TPA: sigma-70 family RNA polymerase sigma factor [Myxococcaceae bacterium]|nr:sigma-70 family RNA polymerase sigma factor [Myxococcaceae bacterium]
MVSKDVESREQLERTIREHCERGEHGKAAEVAMQGYGPELSRFIAAVLQNEDTGREVFAGVTESIWKALPKFRWGSSFRTWAYCLARNACYQYRRSPAGREVPSSSPVSPEESQKQRSRTNPWQRTDVKEGFRKLRERLDLEDRTLLVLRVDRQLSWPEVARVMAEGDEVLSGEALNRKAAALRQQFQKVKSRLRQLAVEEGLIDPDAPGVS